MELDNNPSAAHAALWPRGRTPPVRDSHGLWYRCQWLTVLHFHRLRWPACRIGRDLPPHEACRCPLTVCHRPAESAITLGSLKRQSPFSQRRVTAPNMRPIHHIGRELRRHRTLDLSVEEQATVARTAAWQSNVRSSLGRWRQSCPIPSGGRMTSGPSVICWCCEPHECDDSWWAWVSWIQQTSSRASTRSSASQRVGDALELTQAPPLSGGPGASGFVLPRPAGCPPATAKAPRGGNFGGCAAPLLQRSGQPLPGRTRAVADRALQQERWVPAPCQCQRRRTRRGSPAAEGSS